MILCKKIPTIQTVTYPKDHAMHFANRIVLILVAVCLILPLPVRDADAHHSRSRFDTSGLVEVEGELVLFSWRNPHVRIRIKGTDENGEEVTWDMEGDSLSILRRTNARPENVEVGSQVRAAGFKTVRPSNDMLVYNLLLEDGREILVNVEAVPRWSNEISGDESTWLVGGTASESRGDIFRVWSSQFEGDTAPYSPTEYPLTEFAKSAKAAFDPTVDVVAEGCKPKGMPMIMGQPYPMEFVRDGEDILLKLEEYDTVRRIHMPTMPDMHLHEPSLLGHSDGRWEGDTLVVQTGQIDFPYFSASGIPLTTSAYVVERFRVSDDNSRLEYERLVTDVQVFEEPVSYSDWWVWRPGELVQPYECEERSGTD